jgi:murein L,D-transpeptidase YafK
VLKKRPFFLIAILCAIIGAWIWYNQQFETPPIPQPAPTPIIGDIDHILIEKEARRLTVFQNDIAVKTYPIGLGFAPKGDKIKEGDGKTPEGLYKINRRNPNSKHTLSLGIDYPQAEDLERAQHGGYSAGGDIFIHGQPNSLKDSLKIKGDWTAGCIAVSNTEIREVWASTPIGTTVEIRP